MALFQQGTQRIEVIVKRDSGGGSYAGGKEKELEDMASETQDTQSGSTNRQQASDRRKRRIVVTNTTHAYAVSKQISGLIAEYFISGMGATHGDQAYQDQMRRQMEVFEDTTNLASSVVEGAVYGAWGGPIGLALGMMFSTLSTGTSIVAKYKTREREYNFKMFKEENSIEYRRSRAKINMTTGRLR